MKTIETHGTVTPGGQLSVRVPVDIPPGEHRVVVVVDEQPAMRETLSMPDFPVLDLGPWPDDLSLRRADMYDDDGR